MDRGTSGDGSLTERASHVSCPRCSLRYQATVWQVFDDAPGNCPRCLGLQGIEQAMSWVLGPRPRATSPAPRMREADRASAESENAVKQ